MHTESMYYGTYLDVNNIRREMAPEMKIIRGWYRIGGGVITQLESIGHAEVVCRDVETNRRRTISMIAWNTPGRVHYLPDA